MPVKDALGLVARVTGRAPRAIPLPAGAFVRAAGALEEGFRLARRDPPLCRETAAAIVHGHSYDGSRATRELGLSYTAPEETVRRTLAWFGQRGLLKR
jgi:dihydroflavonol-4-reductase